MCVDDWQIAVSFFFLLIIQRVLSNGLCTIPKAAANFFSLLEPILYFYEEEKSFCTYQNILSSTSLNLLIKRVLLVKLDVKITAFL